MYRLFFIAFLGWMCVGCDSPKSVEQDNQTTNATQKEKPKVNETFKPQYVSKVESEIVLDGAGTEKDWDKAEWRNLDQLMLGDAPTKEDFNGRYKLLWDERMLYILAEIQDDVFIDINKDGLDHYWDDDCFEIFIDQDRSRGDHKFNYNAFAYHISLDDKVVDIGIDESPLYLNDHLKLSKKKEGNQMTWEVGIKVYSDKYNDKSPEDSRVKLATNDKIGFMVAYCDNDSSKERESFIGDMFIKGEDKNKGWIDAGVFGQINLK